MTTIKLPKQIVRTINKLRASGCSDAMIVVHALQSKKDTVMREYFSSTPKMNVLIKALANGFEEELSAEESILSYYSYAKEHANSRDWDLYPAGKAKVEAIEFVLNQLDVKIKGINTDK